MEFSLLFRTRDFEKIKDLQHLRERLILVLLHVSLLLGSVLYITALIPVFQEGLTLPPLLYTMLYIWVALVAFVKRTPYVIRAGSWVIFFYLFGVINLAYSGFNVDSGLFFLTYVLMAVLFFDLKQGMLALGISVASIALFGFTIINGHVEPGLALPQTDPILWIIGGLVFLMGAVILIFPLSVLMRGLASYLEKARLESEELKRTNQVLQLSEERYRSLVEISPDLITLINMKGDATLTNQPGLALFGYSPGDQMGDDYLMFIAPEDRPRIAQMFQRTLEVGFVRDVVCQCIRKDGQLFEAEFSTSLVRNAQGEPEAVVAVGKDITTRRNAERVLQEAREELEKRVMERTAELRSAKDRLTHLLTHSPTVLYASSLEEGFPITFVSENISTLMGYSSEQLTTNPLLFQNCLYPQDANVLPDMLDRILETGNGVMEYRLKHQNGEYRWVRDRVQLVRSPDGQPLELVGSRIDITAQKQAEESYQTLIDNSVQGTAVFQDGRIVYANEKLADSFGITLEELKTLTADQIIEFLHPDDHLLMWSMYQSRLSGESGIKNYEIRIQQLSGEIRYLVVSSVPITYTGKPGLQITAFDITARKNMEQALHERDEIQRAILNATQESLILADRNEEVLAVNQTAAERIGRQPEDMIGVSLPKLFPEEVAKARSARFTSVVETGEILNYEEEHEGHIFDVNLYPVFNDYGGVMCVVISARDITERKRMEQALRESEETAQTMMNATPSVMVLVDSDGRILSVNDFAARMVGLETHQLAGRKVQTIFPEEFLDGINPILEQAFISGEPMHYDHNLRGTWLEVHLHPIKDKNGRVMRMFIFAIDLTERRRMEQALREGELTLRTMIDATPSSLMMVDAGMRFLAANRIAAERLGMDVKDLVGKKGEEVLPEEVYRSRQAHMDEVFRSGCHVTFEDFRGGYWFENHVYPIAGEDGQVKRLVVSARDMTERKKMEEALRESEETWRIMMNATSSILGMLDSELRLLAANKALLDRLNMNVDQALGQDIFQLIPEGAADSRKIHIDHVFKTGRQAQFDDFRNGIWYENHIYPIQDEHGQVTRVVFVAIDLTERMHIEKSLQADKEELEARVAERTIELSESREQLRALTRDVVTAQEEERRRISRELHDEAGQALVSMKYSLESILADLAGKNPSITRRLNSSIKQIDETMEQIRFLAHSLRPPLLDIADLDLTIRDYCSEFGESTKLKVEYTGESLPSLTDQAELAFFRFLQEALTNVVKHARADRVQVRLKKHSRYLSLIVTDNGIGRQDATSMGQGHLGMKERFRVLDGVVRIRSCAGSGFIILARVPWLKVLKDDPQGD